MTEASKQKFCKDCMWHRKEHSISVMSTDWTKWRCVAPQNRLPTFNLITGEPRLIHETISEARIIGCSEEGKWFQTNYPPAQPTAEQKIRKNLEQSLGMDC